MFLALTAMLLWSFATQAATDRALPFSDTAWQLDGERTRISQEGGRDVLEVETGFAHRRDVQFQNGTIDFDVQLTRRRSFVYVHFRVEASGEREEFYLRPHKSNLPDALQYAPVWQGRSAWQLHHGPGGTAPAEFAPAEWTHVRVVVQGPHAALFIGDMATPALLVPSLARAPRVGSIAFGGFLPANVPGSGPIAKFANVVVRPGAVGFDFASAIRAAAPPPATPPGAEIVREWAVSKSFVPNVTADAGLPSAGELGALARIVTDANGLINFHQHVAVPAGARLWAVVARVHVRATRAGTYSFDMGYSDTVKLFVNGRPLYGGDAGYSFDRPRREGLIGFDQARLYLPLNAGDNEISVVVADVFGGWGLMGRFVDAAGLVVEAR